VTVYNFGGTDSNNVSVAANSGYHLTVAAVSGADMLQVTDVSGGAVIHNFPSGSGSGRLQVLYPSIPGGLLSEVFYQGVTQLSTSPPIS
jgi:hypothetical protein